MTRSFGYGAQEARGALAPMHFERRALRADDIAIDIDFCGVCHSDAHQVNNDWNTTLYPCVPGHEIVGRVTAVGPEVTRFKLGDRVAVGCLVDSCLHCGPCGDGEEQLCEKGPTATYNGRDRQTGETTLGGYSDHIVVREHFVVRVPDALDGLRAAPLMCAGITVWNPLRRYNVGAGTKMAVIGLGGLGHIAVKLGVALGAEVTVITSSPGKVDDALKLGAHNVLLSSDAQAMQAAASRFDFILDTIPQRHNTNPYLMLLGRNGKLVVVGAIDLLEPVHGGLLIRNNRTLAGSLIGGVQATQELLDFCAEHQVLPECERIEMAGINEAFERMLNNDVKYRFVVDMATLREAQAA